MLKLNRLLVISFYVSIQIIGRCHVNAAGTMVATADLYQNQQGQTGTLINVGQVNFTQDLTTNVVHVTGSVRGLPQAQNNMFGFHVHEYGTTGNNCNAAGLHYNPKNVTHGAPWDSVRHVGDFGNINRTQGASDISIDFYDSVIKLTGPYTIAGRALVVHYGVDDYGKNASSNTSAISGNAGQRFACGIIGITSDYNVGRGSSLTINFYSIACLVAFIFAKAHSYN